LTDEPIVRLMLDGTVRGGGSTQIALPEPPQHLTLRPAGLAFPLS